MRVSASSQRFLMALPLLSLSTRTLRSPHSPKSPGLVPAQHPLPDVLFGNKHPVAVLDVGNILSNLVCRLLLETKIERDQTFHHHVRHRIVAHHISLISTLIFT